MILFTAEGFDNFINEYNKSGNPSAFDEAKFKLNNLSFSKLKDALISEKQFTFVQLNRLGISDMDEMFNEMSELFKSPISYMLLIGPYDGLHGYQLRAIIFGYKNNERYVGIAMLRNSNTWKYFDITEY